MTNIIKQTTYIAIGALILVIIFLVYISALLSMVPATVTVECPPTTANSTLPHVYCEQL